MATRAVRKTEAPKRDPLTPERIFTAALDLVDAHGLEALSMRKLGAELGVEAMSLYNHVANKEAVLEGVLGLLLSKVELPPMEGEHWAEGLKAAFGSFRRVMLAHPNALPLVAAKPEASPNIFEPIEASLAALRGAGFPPEEALQAHWALVGFTLGHLSFQVGHPEIDPDEYEVELAIRRHLLPRDRFPTLHEVLPYSLHCDFEDAYAFGMDLLIEGLRLKLARD